MIKKTVQKNYNICYFKNHCGKKCEALSNYDINGTEIPNCLMYAEDLSRTLFKIYRCDRCLEANPIDTKLKNALLSALKKHVGLEAEVDLKYPVRGAVNGDHGILSDIKINEDNVELSIKDGNWTSVYVTDGISGTVTMDKEISPNGLFIKQTTTFTFANLTLTIKDEYAK